MKKTFGLKIIYQNPLVRQLIHSLCDGYSANIYFTNSEWSLKICGFYNLLNKRI